MADIPKATTWIKPSTITPNDVNKLRHLRKFILREKCVLIGNPKSDKQYCRRILLAKEETRYTSFRATWTDFAQYSNQFSQCQFIGHGNEYMSSDTHVCHPHQNMRCIHFLRWIYRVNTKPFIIIMYIPWWHGAPALVWMGCTSFFGCTLFWYCCLLFRFLLNH